MSNKAEKAETTYIELLNEMLDGTDPLDVLPPASQVGLPWSESSAQQDATENDNK